MQMQTRTFSQQEIRDAAVLEHNKLRRAHGVPDIKGSRQMHETAQQWAEYLATTNRFEPTTLAKYGNCIATSFKESEIEAVRDAIKAWYEGSKFYDYDRPADDKKTGGFTTLVWKATTEMGIGVAWNEMEKFWVVTAFYYPPVQRGKFGENVLRPK